jgi:DNA-binding protein YbaB
MAGINEAMRKVDEESSKRMNSVTGGMSMPGMPF